MSGVDIFEDYESALKEIERLNAENAALKTAVEKFTSHNIKQSTPLSSKCIGCGAIINNVYCDDCRRKLAS